MGVDVYSGPRQCFHCHPKNNTPLIASPLISTKTSDESQIFFNKFLAKKIHFRSKKIIKKNIALAMFGRDEWRELQFIMSPNLYIVILHDIR